MSEDARSVSEDTRQTSEDTRQTSEDTRPVSEDAPRVASRTRSYILEGLLILTKWQELLQNGYSLTTKTLQNRYKTATV